jgi:hypothetical protein
MARPLLAAVLVAVAAASELLQELEARGIHQSADAWWLTRRSDTSGRRMRHVDGSASCVDADPQK